MSDFEIVNNVLVKYSGPSCDLVIPEGITEIGDKAFHNTNNGWNDSEYLITVPKGVKRIGEDAFSFCRFSNIELPDGLEEIGKGAFDYSYLVSVRIPYGIKTIKASTFQECEKLQNVEIPDSVVSIEKYAFRKTGIKELVLPEGLEEIGEEAFRNCRNIKEIILPSSLKCIKDRAFAECDNLTKVTVLGKLEEYGKDVFEKCRNVEIISPNPEFLDIIHRDDFIIDENKTLVKYNGTGENVVLPEGIITIGENAFEWHTEVKNIKLPESLEVIKGGYQPSTFGSFINMKSIVIPQNVRTIEGFAFYGCSSLTEMTLPMRTITSGMFGLSSKTIIFNAIDDEGKIHRNYAVFRKEHWVQVFKYPKDYIFPVNDEDYDCYDRVLAGGNYDGFTMNENGRVRACLWRLADKEHPLSAELYTGIVEFLASKITKAIKTAEEDKAPEYITTMVNCGVISDDNRKRVTNALKKSEVPEVAAMIDKLTPSQDATVSADKQVRKPEDELDKKLRKNKATELLLKAGVDNIPDVLLADKSAYADNRTVKYIVSEYLKKNEDKYFSAEADAEAEKLDRDSLNSALRKMYNSIYSEKNELAFLKPLFRYADGKTITELYPSLAKSKWKLSRVNDALILSDTREAMLYADKRNVLGLYAYIRGTSADILRDTVLSEFDLDENGKKTYDLGNTTVTATLMPDLSLQLYDEKAGKVVKSIPKKGADENRYQEASKDYDDLRKNVKKVVKNRVATLFRLFLNKEKYEADDWKNIYLKNPVLNKVGQLVVWMQDKTTFTITDKGIIGYNGKPYQLNDSKIMVAHPMEMSTDEITGWQYYFAERKLKQPFVQVWEPVTDKASVSTDRYKGIMIPYYRFLNQEKHGITVMDYDFHNDINIHFKGCDADVIRIDYRRHEIRMEDRFEVEKLSFKRYSRQVNHIIAFLDRITSLERIKKDDVSVMDIIDAFNIEQIMGFISTAQKENAVNVLALLLEYKNNHYPDYTDVDSLTLDL
ncbi:MAG: leucine-rich repeat protein [Erysipelotrichaceae bacterium]|nr:leucine-rich repeat protein [Erysipelotrichaceae bacterium]